jgi:hypothetical protein
MYKLNETEKAELRNFADLEGCETGELCTLLINYTSYGDYMSDEFEIAWEKEIRRMFEDFKTNFEIVQHNGQDELNYIGD